MDTAAETDPPKVPKTLLLVEDEVSIAMSEARQLNEAGYAVLHACSGEEAIQQVQANPGIDLILMDINQAEEKLQQIVSAGETLRISEQAQRMIHELCIHQVELEVQNEALRQAQDELVASCGHYRELYDFAPTGYFTLDKDVAILEANLAGAALLNMERDQLIGQSFTRFVARQDQDRFHI
jgi:CheY-like chemotaxis protein